MSFGTTGLSALATKCPLMTLSGHERLLSLRGTRLRMNHHPHGVTLRRSGPFCCPQYSVAPIRPQALTLGGQLASNFYGMGSDDPAYRQA